MNATRSNMRVVQTEAFANVIDVERSEASSVIMGVVGEILGILSPLI
jgi:hypothetical protein